MAEGRFRIGTVTAAHPAKREVVIAPVPAARHEFAEREWLRIAASGQPERRYKIESMQIDDDKIRAVFGPGVPRDTVAQLTGATVSIADDERRARTAEEYTLGELLGMTVVDSDDASLGAVVDAYSGGGNDVLEVEQPDGKRFLFPLIPESVSAIDFDSGIISVNDLTPFRVDHAD